jgi:hypothetical protein
MTTQELIGAREVRSLSGHTDKVVSVSISGDGGMAVSGSKDQAVKVWDLGTGHCTRTFTGHRGWVYSVVMSRDGRLVASGGQDKTCRVWDVEAGACIKTFADNQHEIMGVCMTPDARRVLTVGALDVKCWDLESGSQAWVGWHTAVLQSVSVSEDGRRAVTTSADKFGAQMKLWDVSKGEQIREIHAHREVVYSACFSPDGIQLLSGSADRSMILWDAATGRSVRQFEGPMDGVLWVTFAGYGRYACSAHEDGTIVLWNVATGTRITTLTGHRGFANCICVDSEGRTAVSAGDDGTLKLWDLKWQTQAGVQDTERVSAEAENARKGQEDYRRARIESADRAWAEAERAATAAESARTTYQDARRKRELGPLTPVEEAEVHALWVQVNLTEVKAKTAQTSAEIASEGAEMAEYRRARAARVATSSPAQRAPEPSPVPMAVSTRRSVERSSAEELYPATRVKRGRLWHLFHPRGFTRKLTPAELGIARGPADKRKAAVLWVECHKCEMTFSVPWANLPDTAAMTPPERFRFVTTNETTYPCPRCRRQFFVTWSGKAVTIMMRRGQR